VVIFSFAAVTFRPVHIAEGQVVQGIAQQYPCDVGIQNDPAVVFTENFEENSIGTMAARWNDNDNTGGMSFTTDVPATSSGTHSLQMTAVGGSTSGGYLYKNFAPASYDTLYVRYYVKFPSNFPGLHHLVTMGGRNPASNFPIGSAGTQPTGSDRFSSSVEPSGSPFVWDFYTYWMNMRSWNGSQYFGNGFNPSPAVPLTLNTWFPIEFMIKMNTPVTSLNGEQAVWIDGVLRQHLAEGSPLGSWSSDEFFPSPSGSPFEGFQWRSTTALSINYLWFQYYHETGGNGVTDRLTFDDLVVATQYIGPMVACGSQGGDTTPPTVSMTAPAPSATVSGLAVTVSANASDDVGVAGVQFRLDGANLGAEDTSAPYSLTWDTTAVSNGSHTLAAIARDAAGNTTTASTVAVTVSNTGQFSIGNHVRVTALLNVRQTPGGTVLGNHDTGALATVVGGPVQQGGSTWWDLDYDVAPDGWSGDIYLELYQDPQDTTPPTVSMTAPSNNATVSGTVSVTATSADAVGVAGVQFRLDGANLGSEDVSAPYGVSWDTTGASNGSHTLTAISRDAAGNTTTATALSLTVNNVVADTTPPTISSVTAGSITTSGATITWTTNESADTQVEYGLSTSYGSQTVLNASMVASHTQILSGLAGNTLYHYRVKSKDAAGNLRTSGDFTFTTTATSDTTPPGPVTNLNVS